jgi:propanol-preferring alcohol dehydrogenase
MKAMMLIEVGNPLQLAEVEVPKPKGNQVLVKIEGAGVCHSDVHMRSGKYGKISLKDRGIKLPLIPGHEIAGEVEEVGEEVTSFSKREKVAVNPWIGEGSCYYCRIGEEQFCQKPRRLGVDVNGGFAEYVLVPHYKYLYKLKRLTPVEAAPFTCSGITTYRAIRRASLDPSKSLVIVGAGGGLGTMAIQIAKAYSGATVIAVDVREEALELAKRAGADYVVDGKRDPVSEIRRITERGADAVLDLNNSDLTLRTYPNCLAKQGKYIMVGLYGGDLNYHAPFITLMEQTFMGSYVGNQTDFMGIMSLAESGKVKPMITRVMKLEEVNQAIDNLEHARVTGRQVLVP